MYRKHFGLTRHPFDKRIEPEELFASAGLRELEARSFTCSTWRGIASHRESGSGRHRLPQDVASLHTVFIVSCTFP